MLEIGPGPGYFSPEVAQRIPEFELILFDIQKEMLAKSRSKLIRTGHKYFRLVQDIPSMGFGGAGSSTDDLKKRAIGRKRNTYGKALGDILLNENQTVESVTENAIKQSFSAAGYAIVNREQDIDDDTILLDAKITKFWAYMTPGFWAITLTSDISTDLELSKKRGAGSKVEKITVKAEGKYQVATENNWMEIVDKAVSQYIEKLKELIENQLSL